jgi:hypothetical protein
MTELTRRAFLKLTTTLALWAGLGPLRQVAAAVRPTPPAQPFGFPLVFPARFLTNAEKRGSKDLSHGAPPPGYNE